MPDISFKHYESETHSCIHIMHSLIWCTICNQDDNR